MTAEQFAAPSRTLPVRLAACLITLFSLSACSMNQLLIRGSQSLLDSSVTSMNRESDLQLAREALPATLKLIEAMLIEDPDNEDLHLYAAEGFYGYSFGFIEAEDSRRAASLYQRCYAHALQALQLSGFDIDPKTSNSQALQSTLAGAAEPDVAAMFWTASCLGKLIDHNRHRPGSLAALSNTAVLMERVRELDEKFYYGGAHLFFGVYYGSRAPLFGGDFAAAEASFRRAASINDNRLLLVDVLQAEFLDRQKLDRQAFHDRLSAVIEADADAHPEYALINGISKQRAQRLLQLEQAWF